MAERTPDRLSAEARRWVCGITYATDRKLILAVLAALSRYYSDVVVEGIARWRLERIRDGDAGLDPLPAPEPDPSPPPKDSRHPTGADDDRGCTLPCGTPASQRTLAP